MTFGLCHGRTLINSSSKVMGYVSSHVVFFFLQWLVRCLCTSTVSAGKFGILKIAWFLRLFMVIKCFISWRNLWIFTDICYIGKWYSDSWTVVSSAFMVFHQGMACVLRFRILVLCPSSALLCLIFTLSGVINTLQEDYLEDGCKTGYTVFTLWIGVRFFLSSQSCADHIFIVFFLKDVQVTHVYLSMM